MEIEEISFLENNENSTFSDQYQNPINSSSNILPYFLKKPEKPEIKNFSDNFFTNLNFLKKTQNLNNKKIQNFSKGPNFTKGPNFSKKQIFAENEISFNEDILQQQNNESILVHDHISNNSFSFDEDEYGTFFFNKNGEKIYFETDSDNDTDEPKVGLEQGYYSDN